MKSHNESKCVLSLLKNGTHPEHGSAWEVQDGIYPDTVEAPDLDVEPQLTTPDGRDQVDPAKLAEYAGVSTVERKSQ